MIAMLLLAQLTADPLLELELGSPKVSVTIHEWDDRGFLYSLKSDPSKRYSRDWASLSPERIVEIAEAYSGSLLSKLERAQPLKLQTIREGPHLMDLSLPPFWKYLSKEKEPVTLIPLSIRLKTRKDGEHFITKLRGYDDFRKTYNVLLVTEGNYDSRVGWDYQSGDNYLIISAAKAKVNRLIWSTDNTSSKSLPHIEMVIQRHVVAGLPKGAAIFELETARRDPDAYVRNLEKHVNGRFSSGIKVHQFPELKLDGFFVFLPNGRVRYDFVLSNLPLTREIKLSSDQIIKIYKTQAASFIKAYRDFQSSAAKLNLAAAAEANVINSIDRTFQFAQSAKDWNEYWNYGPGPVAWWENLADWIDYCSPEKPSWSDLAFSSNAAYAANEQSINVTTLTELNRQNQKRAFLAGVQQASANTAAGSLRKMQSMQQQLVALQLLLFYLEFVNASEFTIEYAVVQDGRLLACAIQ